jgi:aminopeptidase N
MANLDPKSLEFAKTSLPRITDPFTRHLVAFTLWEMVKAGKWTVAEFGPAALGWVATETNKPLLDDLTEMLENSRASRISVSRLLEGDARTKFRAELQKLARKKAENASPGSDLQKIWFKLALRTLATEDADWAVKLATKKAKISGLKIDPDLRWEILLAVARVKSIDPEVLAAAEKDDTSSAGQNRLLEVKAASSDLAADFPALFALEKVDPAIPQTRLKKAAGTYLSSTNPDRTVAWRPKFFASLESVAAKSDESYFRAFAQSLYPALCSTDVATETNAWIAAHPKAPTVLRVTLTKMAFSEAWCAAIRAGHEFPLWTPPTVVAK